MKGQSRKPHNVHTVHKKQQQKSNENADSLGLIGKPSKKKPKQKVSSDALVPVSAKLPPAIDIKPAALWPVLSEKAYPGWLGEFVKLACAQSEADPVAVLMTLLLRIAAEVYGVFFNVGDSKQMARTNAVLVGESAKARKGTSAKPVNRLFSKLNNAARMTPGPLTSGPGLVYNVRDECLEYDKKTGEYLVKDPGVTDKRLFVQDEEFETTLSSIKTGGNTLSATIRCLFDDGNSEPLTKTNRIKTTGAHVAILAHITRAELTAVLNKVSMANGFGNRFLWMLVRRQKPIAMPKPMPANAVKRFQKILVKVLEAAKGLGELQLTAKADRLWEDSYPELTMEFSGVAGELSSRSEAHALRVAEVYAIALGHKMIQSADLEAAIAIVQYARESTAIIFQGCPGDKGKVKILQALRASDKNKMTLTDISKKVFKRNYSSEAIQQMLEELVSSKLVELKKVNIKKPGRHKTLVKLVSVGSTITV